MKRLLFCFSVFLTASCFAQSSLNIIPAPVKADLKEGTFTLSPSTKIVLEASNVEKSAAFLNKYIKTLYGFELKIVKGNAYPENAIILNYDRLDNQLPGAYELKVNKDNIYIGGDNEEGVFYGIQTLIQLLPTEKSKALILTPNCQKK